MRVLKKNELQVAEQVLRNHFPRSYEVYGFLYNINRNKPNSLEVIVDQWPNFKVIICRPDPMNNSSMEFSNRFTFYSTDEEVMSKMLRDEKVVDWSAYFLVGGFDFSYGKILKEVAAEREVNHKSFCLVHLMYLPDINSLPTLQISSELQSRISSLNLSHVDLVNKTWKFGGNEQGQRNVQNLISNFPSFCITDNQGQIVSWILMYDFCALGLLYTLPEHRGKGYAKVLVSTMVKKIYAEGYPVYCFIEEENTASYFMFKNMGFVEDPSYRTAWFEFKF